MYRQLKKAFIGLNTRYKLANKNTTRRIYLDSGASTLMLKPAYRATESYLSHYANTHTTVHTSAKITSKTYDWAHKSILNFTGANHAHYLCTFIGSGTTAAANRVAMGLHLLRPEKSVVLVSTMEHHSNDLPHRNFAKHVEHIPLHGQQSTLGEIDLTALKDLLEKHKNNINYVAITAVSNVTGIINPIKKIAALVHKYDAYLVVDGAQMVAHMPVQLSDLDIDFFLFSGHKAYAPGSPGVLIGKKEIMTDFPPAQYGGGMVSAVTKWGYQLVEETQEREYAGTPNIPGIIMLACALECLNKMGMEKIYSEEKELMCYTLKALQTCRTLKIYGDIENSQRISSIAFNLKDIGHGLVAAILNDYHGIAVRNQCFCAHPYVQEMLSDEFEILAAEHIDNETLEKHIQDRRGMVRASFGLYTTKDDINELVNALQNIEKNIEYYREFYLSHDDGSYSHKTYDSLESNTFDIVDELNKTLIQE